jgi:signal transduction histidine kinase/ActR/RegA family two-component response regulator
MKEQGKSTDGGYLIKIHQLCLICRDILMFINSNHDVDEIFRNVVREMRKGLGCESARIAMREGDNWVIRYVNNLPDNLIGQSFTDEELPYAALAMTTRKPVAIDYASHDDRTNTEMIESLEIKSVLALPLMEKNVVTGTLLFDYISRAVPFAEVEIAFAERVTTGVAIALQNARFHKELEESKRLNEALNEIDTVLYSMQDYDAIMKKMLQLATDVIGAETAVIFSKEGDRWRTRYVYKLPESLVGQSFSNTEVMHTAITAETKRSIVIQDVSNNQDIDQKFVEMLGIRSLLDFPLIVKGEVIGDLTFHYHSSAVPFNESQVEFARKLQISISLALETGRLFSVAEDAVAGRKQAETAVKTKSQFLANMSHELRTPMTGVLGMLDLALSGKLEAEPREFINAAHTSALSMVQILNDILDLTKIEMGKFSIVVKPFCLRKCVEDTFNIFLPAAKCKGLDLNFTVADDVPETLVGDHARFNQVLVNLVGNAVKFTEKGKVKIGVAAGCSAPGSKIEVTITVADTGIGIPDDKKHLLFHAFSQVDESDSRGYGGTGLGLAISKEIVELMGGTITFTSEEGVGSTFSFTILLAEASRESDSQSAAKPLSTETTSSAPEGERIRRLLLVDDDSTIREFLGHMLTMANYYVDFAENGLKAVEMWEKAEYDLVLMDIQMPLLNGFEATRVIREKERERGFHTPIVAVTAHASKEDEQRCFDAGMDAFISKPIDFEKTLQVIKQNFKQKSCDAR